MNRSIESAMLNRSTAERFTMTECFNVNLLVCAVQVSGDTVNVQ